MATIAVKNIDEKLYRRAKALASLRGRTVGEAVNEALAIWISGRTTVDLLDKWEDLEGQSAANNRTYESIRGGLLAEHPGEYAVIASGKLLGVYRLKEEAYSEASKARSGQGIVAHLVEAKPREVELGWSLLEDVTR